MEGNMNLTTTGSADIISVHGLRKSFKGRRGKGSPQLVEAVRAAGLPLVRLHDLRHTFATLALAQGVGLATVAELLGHSGVSITAQHYAAIVPELRQDAAAAVDRALAGTAS